MKAEKSRRKQGGKPKLGKLKSIFRKRFICRPVKLTRGVYLPALPSLPLYVAICCGPSASLRRRHCGPKITNKNNKMQIHYKITCFSLVSRILQITCKIIR